MSGSFCRTVSFPNFLPVRSVKVGDRLCRRQPQDFVPCEDPGNISNLPAITREIAYRVKTVKIYANEDEEKRFANMEAHAVWCYFGMD